jgi:CspA family cold shock protein
MAMTGTVKFFNGERGYGFIKPDDGGRDVFVHITAVERAGLKDLTEGQRISFEVEPDVVDIARSTAVASQRPVAAGASTSFIRWFGSRWSGSCRQRRRLACRAFAPTVRDSLARGRALSRTDPQDKKNRPRERPGGCRWTFLLPIPCCYQKWKLMPARTTPDR